MSPSLWFMRLVARADFQKLASLMPFGKSLARRDGAEIFDILQGFVKSQTLLALIDLDVLSRLLDAPTSPAQLGLATGVPEDQMARLLSAGAAMKLLKRRRDGRYALARRGAAILGVPGLTQMILHNRALYDDMADPVALLRGQTETHLAQFWPYVFGQAGDMPEDIAGRYSKLMAQSQLLVAHDTLKMVKLKGVTRLLDVGGGSGAFLTEVLRRYPNLQATLLDLPEVIPSAKEAFKAAGLEGRVDLHPGSFRDGALPLGADAISLIRVLYDHSDETVTDLLSKVHQALPAGGRLIVSEPMSGGAKPDPAGDIYFNFYTMAMGTGRVRSAADIAGLCRDAGFENLRSPRPLRPYVTSVVTCEKPA
ncbi:methyltransferase [Roseovarius sp. 2305UL8-3]|uniref:methyltransferase n=1 Tax=Roseovarius conchicola TaxID=3121636 RepID=UPI0035290CB2